MEEKQIDYQWLYLEALIKKDAIEQAFLENMREYNPDHDDDDFYEALDLIEAKAME